MCCHPTEPRSSDTPWMFQGPVGPCAISHLAGILVRGSTSCSLGVSGRAKVWSGMPVSLGRAAVMLVMRGSAGFPY